LVNIPPNPRHPGAEGPALNCVTDFRDNGIYGPKRSITGVFLPQSRFSKWISRGKNQLLKRSFVALGATGDLTQRQFEHQSFFSAATMMKVVSVDQCPKTTRASRHAGRTVGEEEKNDFDGKTMRPFGAYS